MKGKAPGGIKETAFGPMRINPDAATAPVGASGGVAAGSAFSPQAVRQALGSMYEVEPKTVSFPSDSQERITKTVRFINRGSARLSLSATEEIHSLKGLLIEFDSRKLEPEEESLITFTYQPDIAPIQGIYHIVFSVLPIKQLFVVAVEFVGPAVPAAPASEQP